MFKDYEEAKEVVEFFRTGLKEYKEKPIVLYGLGINTKVLIQNLTDYHIVGLMDAKHEGETFEGLPIYSEEEVKTLTELIVIVARAAVVPIIYNRIKHLEQTGITICNVRGEALSSVKNMQTTFPDHVSEEKLKKAILVHDVICFDIFDTLISRKIVKPEDLFEIVEKRLKRKGLGFTFSELRKKAAAEAHKKSESPPLEQIYEELASMAGIEKHAAEEIMQEELETELDYVAPRKAIIAFMKYAKENGKTVCLVSDMYLIHSQMKRILDQCGIREYDVLFISCEYGKTKWPQGNLFKEVKEAFPGQTILHIGDNEGADVACAQKQGLDAIRILSIYEILVQSSFQTLLSFNRTVGDSIAIGIFASEHLSDPFKLVNSQGRVPFEEERDVGFVCYGPLIVGFLAWIKRQCEQKNLSNIAFLARDGWILSKAWEIMKNNFETAGLPEGQYVLGSRRALAVPALRTEQDLADALQKVPKAMKNANMLRYRFGIECSDVSENEEKGECVFRRKGQILERAKQERCAYNRYLNSLVPQGGKIAIVDAVSAGTIGKYFFSVTEREGCLLCMAISKVPNYSVCDEIAVEAYMGEDSKYAPKWQIHKHVGELEGVLTSLDPMFLCFGENGAACYDMQERNITQMRVLQKVHDGILEYVQDLCTISPDLETMEVTPELCDTFFGLLYERNICISETVKRNLAATSKF